MKRVTPILAATLLLGSSAFWFVSCAGNEIKDPQPPVTVLKSEPVSASDSGEIAPAILMPRQETHFTSSKPLAVSHAAAVPVRAVPAAIVIDSPAAVKTGHSLWDNRWLPWLLLLLALLVLWKAIRELRQKNAATPPSAAGKKSRWIPVMAFSKAEKEIAVTAFYQGQEHKMHFSPGATVKKVTAWAAYQCGIFDLTTTEVYLAIQGYSAPLTGTAHIGRFMMRHQHHLELDVLTFAKDRPPAAATPLARNSPLAEDEILVEGAGMTQTVKVAINPEAPLKEVIGSVARIGHFPPQNAFIFLENESNPLNPNLPPDARHPRDRVHHVHTQMEIMVTAFFNDKERQKTFSPATTINKVAAWAAYEFEVFDQDAAEVYLAIHGYSAPLTGAAHIGRFVEHDKNNLELDLLAFTKANAAV